MRNTTLSRVVAALSAVALLGSLAACGDNEPSAELAAGSSTSSGTPISGNFAGAGASSQQAAVEAWVAGFQTSNPQAKISYNPSGSGAGVTTFLSGATAWAGSDKPLSAEEIKQSESVCASGSAFDVPVYISPIAIVFNLKGISDQDKHVNMDATTIAKIFNGKITQWNDPALVRQNPDITLPDKAITVVHRSDKSGTTQNFLAYVKAAAAKDWEYNLSENWPNSVGQGAKGTSGVMNTVMQADGTIGYADFSQVGKAGTVAIKVGHSYVPISAQAASTAIEDSQIQDPAGTNRVVINVNYTTNAEGAYPIVLVSYDIACPAYKNVTTSQFVKAWLTYVTSTQGQRLAEQTAGTAPLPDNMRGDITKAIDAIEVHK